METTVAISTELESLIRRLQDEGYEYPNLVRLLFGIIDEFCSLFPERKGLGRPLTYLMGTILKLDMLMHLTGKLGETEILREAERHYRGYFKKLLGQARL